MCILGAMRCGSGGRSWRGLAMSCRGAGKCRFRSKTWQTHQTTASRTNRSNDAIDHLLARSTLHSPPTARRTPNPPLQAPTPERALTSNPPSMPSLSPPPPPQPSPHLSFITQANDQHLQHQQQNSRTATNLAKADPPQGSSPLSLSVETKNFFSNQLTFISLLPHLHLTPPLTVGPFRGGELTWTTTRSTALLGRCTRLRSKQRDYGPALV